MNTEDPTKDANPERATRAEGSQAIANSFRIRTYKNPACNSFRMSTYKIAYFNPRRMNTYKKGAGRVPLAVNAEHA